MNTNKINKRKKKTRTNKQTKNQKQKLVNPLANFKAQALLLDEERELYISGAPNENRTENIVQNHLNIALLNVF